MIRRADFRDRGRVFWVLTAIDLFVMAVCLAVIIASCQEIF